jgi:transcriptional regulator GlxA family with amidase domain
VVTGARFTFDDAHADLLLDILPPLIRLPATSDPASALRSALSLLALETAEPRPGADLVADGLARIVFVQVLRAHALAQERPARGWLGALADPKIGAALKLMHQDPVHPWTVGELARAVHMSRSSFAMAFKTLVGRPPLDYLLRWRVQNAARALRDGDRSVASIATELGYASESAFSNAFQRVTGCRPTHYRSAARRSVQPELGFARPVPPGAPQF